MARYSSNLNIKFIYFPLRFQTCLFDSQIKQPSCLKSLGIVCGSVYDISIIMTGFDVMIPGDVLLKNLIRQGK